MNVLLQVHCLCVCISMIKQIPVLCSHELTELSSYQGTLFFFFYPFQTSNCGEI